MSLLNNISFKQRYATMSPINLIDIIFPFTFVCCNYLVKQLNHRINLVAKKHNAPWLFRTYAGHSTAKASNRLYRDNLSKGQTGLSIAFDLPTQTGYDSDHLLAKGEVGKVGVPI